MKPIIKPKYLFDKLEKEEADILLTSRKRISVGDNIRILMKRVDGEEFNYLYKTVKGIQGFMIIFDEDKQRYGIELSDHTTNKTIFRIYVGKESKLLNQIVDRLGHPNFKSILYYYGFRYKGKLIYFKENFYDKEHNRKRKKGKRVRRSKKTSD